MLDTRIIGIHALLALVLSMHCSRCRHQCAARFDNIDALLALAASIRIIVLTPFKAGLAGAIGGAIPPQSNNIYIYSFRWQLGNRTPHHSPIETASLRDQHNANDANKNINNACNVLLVSMRVHHATCQCVDTCNDLVCQYRSTSIQPLDQRAGITPKRGWQGSNLRLGFPGHVL